MCLYTPARYKRAKDPPSERRCEVVNLLLVHGADIKLVDEVRIYKCRDICIFYTPVYIATVCPCTQILVGHCLAVEVFMGKLPVAGWV